MFHSIRNQILMPLIAIQGVAVISVAVTTAMLSARRGEEQIVERLNGVRDTLGHASFPYTAGVLAKMRGLSGAHFAVTSEDGRVTESTLGALGALPRAVQSARPTDRLDSLGDSPTLVLEGIRYLAVPLRAAGLPRGSSLLVLFPETRWRRARWEAAAPPLALGLGTLGLMAIVSGWIAHRISTRIGRVQQQVARIAAGDFQEFDPGSRADEVQDLARSINRMCTQLRGMQQAIRQSERTRLLAQLAAGLAHQLRNSLTGVRMSIQLHARRFPGPGGDAALEVALRQLAMTEEQVQGILALGRVERRPRALCDLGRLLGDVATLVGPSCQHAKVRLRLGGGAAPLSVLADEAGLRAAVLNLALNAIEAAGTGGEVRLATRPSDRDDRAVTIEVSDTGPGPPPEVAESLLEPFVTTKAEGAGLGLALAQQVAADHGGRLSWSREVGRTHFRLTLTRPEVTPEEPR
jgi:signal transduction histidine kinase